MKHIAILFGNDQAEGSISIVNGSLKKLSVSANGRAFAHEFSLSGSGRLDIELGEFTMKRGAFPTIVNVATKSDAFSFFLRDVGLESPIYIPEFKVTVVPGACAMSYRQIADMVNSRGLISDFQRFENEPEESYENAARHNCDKYCHTWLGVSRDIRLFRVGQQRSEYSYKYWGNIQPCFHEPLLYPGVEDAYYHILFEIGPGTHGRTRSTRRLEEGVLPILRAVQDEAEIQYHITAFVGLENIRLAGETATGTEWQEAYAFCSGNMLSPEERQKLRAQFERNHQDEEQLICALRVEAVNIGRTPNYAFFKAPHVAPVAFHNANPKDHKFEHGLSQFARLNKVYAVALINGEAMSEEEMAILIPPGRKITFDILVPHCPISHQRAEKLFKWDFENQLVACRDFWRKKLVGVASMKIPETAIDERVKAGLLHCDLVTFGKEPNGAALATVGWYGPIGSESAPIIQFFDSMGCHVLAERCLDFFFKRQRDDGFIQNYIRYESETGPVLWTAGEHFRYTRDLDWLKRVFPSLRRAADYLLAWRERNKTPECKAAGCYGMVSGKVADPDDFYHAWFLNAGTYIGLARMVELAAPVDSGYSRKLQEEVAAYRQDIVNAVYAAQARAPLVPLGDGSWAPVLPPWVEYTGGQHLYADGGNWFTHGSFLTRGTLAGANWLIFNEILKPDETAANFIVKTNQYPATRENAALSQPYYSRHDFAHIKRNEVKLFLKTYYNQLTALQDRETYTFWEHYHGVGEHKTHEESWFLMQTRWMLYFEEGDTLFMLKAIPRRWLEDGKQIVLDGVKSHFGPIYFTAKSDLKNNAIMAEIKLFEPDRMPARIVIRLPHPEGLKATACDGGRYDPDVETVTISDFNTNVSIRLKF